MLRTCLVLLLLTHYLLVVGVGLVGRPEPVRQHAADYVHSADCQQRNYLRLDCFDQCNGEQYAKPNHKQQSWPQLLSTLKGLDAHCQLSAGLVATKLPRISGTGTLTTDLLLPIPAGFRATLYAPPRRG